MDRRFLTVLAVSLVFALVVSGIVYQITARAGNRSRRSGPTEVKDIVVATRPLGRGRYDNAFRRQTCEHPGYSIPSRRVFEGR